MLKIYRVRRCAALLLSFFFLLSGHCLVAASGLKGESSTITLPRQADASWLQEHRSDNMHVHSRAIAGSVIREVMAESVIAAPPGQVLAVLLDYPTHPSFMPYVVRNTVEKTQGNKTWLFQQLGFPWPISDRYYTIVLSHRDDPLHENSYEIHWDLSHDQPVTQGSGMQVMLNKGGWRLISIEAGQSTKVLYYLYTDPGGALPDWVSNMANTVAVPKVIEAVRKRIQSTSYLTR